MEGAPSVSELKTVVRFGPEGFCLFALTLDGVEKLVARGKNAQRLVSYALEAGALECAHEYDARFS